MVTAGTLKQRVVEWIHNSSVELLCLNMNTSGQSEVTQNPLYGLEFADKQLVSEPE